MILVTVETVAMLNVLTAVGANIGTVLVDAAIAVVDERGEHPKKSGMLTL